LTGAISLQLKDSTRSALRSSWREIFGAGAPAWYSMLALSFLFCEFNPIAAIGSASRLKRVYGGPIGWALTAASFLIALSGFIAAARIAFVDRNRRALEIAGIATIAAGLVPLLVGVEMPVMIMWPISAMFFVTGASALRASGTLPHPDRAEHWSARESSTASAGAPRQTQGEAIAKPQTTALPEPARTGKPRRRRRRRSRNRGRPRDGIR
jgi:hypothetical protein